jgi:hypothetical protein
MMASHIFSSSEHNMLVVSYYDPPLSVVVRRQQFL